MKTRFSVIAASLAACFLALVSTSAQEKSVRPGIAELAETKAPGYSLALDGRFAQHEV